MGLRLASGEAVWKTIPGCRRAGRGLGSTGAQPPKAYAEGSPRTGSRRARPIRPLNGNSGDARFRKTLTGPPRPGTGQYWPVFRPLCAGGCLWGGTGGPAAGRLGHVGRRRGPVGACGGARVNAWFVAN